MATPNVIPSANNTGKLGKSGTQWAEVRGQTIYQDGAQVANLASPIFTGAPTTTTPVSASDNSLKIPTTAWVTTFLTGIYTKIYGTPTAGNLFMSKADGLIEDSGQTTATLLARANHTGAQAQNTVTDLVSDLATLTADVATNATAISGKAATSHTHTSAEVSDATAAATVSKVVKRGSTGEANFASTGSTKAVYATATGSSGKGISGLSSGGSGTAVYGSNTGASGIGGNFYNAGSSGVGLIADNNQAAGAVILSARHSGSNMFEVLTGSKVRLYNTASSYYSEIDHGTLTDNRAVTWPDADGTVVLGDGGGITDAGAFRTALGVAAADSPTFAKTLVTSSTSEGYNFSSGAKLALEDAANTTKFQLPHGGGSTEKLVDGDGRGVTSASAFRTALAAANIAGDTFTGNITIDPASGSNMIRMDGPSGGYAQLTFDSSSTRSIAVPDANGNLAICASGAGEIIATDVTDSTATGRSLMTAANAAAGRATLSASTQAATLGFGVIAGTRNNTNATSLDEDSFEIVHPGTFAVVNGANFTVPSSTLAKVTYGGSVTSNFLITAVMTVKSGASGTATLSARLGLNGATVATTEVSQTFLNATHEDVMTVQHIMSLANTNTVEVYITNESGDDDPTVTDISLTLIPMD
jgi:hypothetical protein